MHISQILTAIFEFLLDNGADITAITNNGISPLMLACLLDNTDAAKFFLQKGATLKHLSTFVLINTLFVDFFSSLNEPVLPYHYVFFHCSGSITALSLLIESGAPMNQRDQNGQTPLHLAAKSSIEILKLFLESEEGKNLVNEQ